MEYVNDSAVAVASAQARALGMSGAGLSMVPSSTWGIASPADAVLGRTRRIPAPVSNHPFRSTVAALAKQGAPPRGEPR